MIRKLLKEEEVHIELFLTKSTNKFRVQIKEKDKPSYQVTVGGKNWNSGMFNKYKKIIETMVLKYVQVISHEASTLF